VTLNTYSGHRLAVNVPDDAATVSVTVELWSYDGQGNNAHRGVAINNAQAGVTCSSSNRCDLTYSIGGADGWTLTDWFENVYLRTAGPEKYDQLTAHEIPWTDQSVVEEMLTKAVHSVAGQSNAAAACRWSSTTAASCWCRTKPFPTSARAPCA